MKKCSPAYMRRFGEEPVTLSRGFVDTTKDLVLTSEMALSASETEAHVWMRPQEKVEKKKKKKKKADSIGQAEHTLQVVRARLSGITFDEYESRVRPISERRQSQALNVTERRTAVEATEYLRYKHMLAPLKNEEVCELPRTDQVI